MIFSRSGFPDTAIAVAIIVCFSDRPLKLSVIHGIALSGISALFSIIIFMVSLFGVFSVPCWTITVLSVWFLSGLMMATLSVHGFYLSRIFAEAQNRPRIVLETRTGPFEAGKKWEPS